MEIYARGIRTALDGPSIAGLRRGRDGGGKDSHDGGGEKSDVAEHIEC